MKLETFFEKFDQFADAPDAVAKMRELVLELAVQGKLVAPSPNPDKHPAWLAFRKEISERVYSYDPGPPPPFEIPAHWEWCVLDEVADCRAAAKVSPAAIRDTDWVLDLEDIDGTTGQIIQTATFAERRSLSTKAAFEPGDVLYGKLRPYLNKVVVAAKRGFCTTEIIPLRPAPFLTPEFLRFYLRSQTFLCYAAQKNYGMKMPRLGTKDLESAEIPVPPPAEQKRIVAKVDELMALCDRLEALETEKESRGRGIARASLARFADAPTPANLNFIFHSSYSIPPADLRKAILTLAVQGKLVPQDPNDEPAEDVLARIATTKLRLQKTGQIGKEKPVAPLQPESLPFEAPESWRWAKLAELTELITKGSSPKWQGIAYVSESEGILFITSENVGNYVLRKLDDLKYVSKGFNEIEPRSILKRGDILMNLVGASIGRTAVYDLHDGANINQAVALIRLIRETDGVCPRFLLHYLNSPAAIDYMLSSRVVNAQPNISLTDAREFAVPIPPLAEQRRIVARVEQLMALVDALQTQLAASRATAANLLSALVAELTGTPNNGKVSAPSASTTGRRGRPPKSP